MPLRVMYTMEDIRIPNISEIRRASKISIDRPATILEVLSSRCGPENTDRTRLFMDVFAKLSRHQGDANGDVFLDDLLYNLVKDFSTSVLLETTGIEDVMRCPKTKSFLGFMKRKFLRTIETIDDDMTKELKGESRVLSNTVKKHQKLMKDLHEAQKNYWRSHSKVTKYKLMVTTAQSSCRHLADKLSPRELRATDISISDLQKKLKVKEGREERDALAFFKLSSQVERTRDEMTKLSKNLTDKITLELVDRLESSLFTLQSLTEAFLPTESRGCFSERLVKVNVLEIVSAVVDKDQEVYTYPNIRECISQNGPNKEIPQSSLS